MLSYLLFFSIFSLGLCRVSTWIDTVHCTVNKNIVDGRIWIDYGPDKSSYSFNVEGNTLVDINEAFVRIIYSTSPIGKRHLSKKVVEHYIDVCKMFRKRNAGAVFVNTFVNLFTKTGKMPNKCPVKKDFYYSHNVTLNGIQFPMKDYLILDHEIIFDVEFFVRINRKLVSAFHPVVYGGYKINP